MVCPSRPVKCTASQLTSGPAWTLASHQTSPPPSPPSPPQTQSCVLEGTALWSGTLTPSPASSTWTKANGRWCPSTSLMPAWRRWSWLRSRSVRRRSCITSIPTRPCSVDTLPFPPPPPSHKQRQRQHAVVGIAVIWFVLFWTGVSDRFCFVILGVREGGRGAGAGSVFFFFVCFFF